MERVFQESGVMHRGKYPIDLTQIDLEQYPECEHMRLGIHIARKFYEHYRGNLPGGLDMGDLVHVAYLALRKAHQNFKPELGKKFSSFAGTIIRDFIRELIREQRMVWVPNYVDFQSERVLNGKPTTECWNKMDRNRKRQSNCMDKAVQLKKMNRRSMEALRTVTIGIHPKWADQEAVAYAMQFIPEEKCKEVLSLRFGLNGERPHTLQEIGDLYGLSRERIRQIEAEGLRIMMECLKDCG